MSDFTFRKICFGSVSWKSNNTGKIGYSITFCNAGKIANIKNKDLDKIITENFRWGIQDVNSLTDNVKSFSNARAIDLLSADYDTIAEVNSALVQLRLEFLK